MKVEQKKKMGRVVEMEAIMYVLFVHDVTQSLGRKSSYKVLRWRTTLIRIHTRRDVQKGSMNNKDSRSLFPSGVDSSS